VALKGDIPTSPSDIVLLERAANQQPLPLDARLRGADRGPARLCSTSAQRNRRSTG